MAKGAKAACPVCGQEVSDPDYQKGRRRSHVIRCANCLSKLEWVRPWWDRWPVVESILVGLPALIWIVGDVRVHHEPLHRVNDYAVWLVGILALIRVALEKAGLLKPKLRVTDRPYEDPEPFTTRVREQRALVATGPKLKINPRSVIPAFLRRNRALPLEEPVRFEPDSEK